MDAKNTVQLSGSKVALVFVLLFAASLLYAGVAQASDATRKDGRDPRSALDIASVAHHYGDGGTVTHTLHTYKAFSSRLLKAGNAIAFAFDTNTDYRPDRLAFVLWYQGHLRGVIVDGRGKPIALAPVSRPNSRTVVLALPVRLFGEGGRYQWLALTTFKNKTACRKTCTDLAPNRGLILNQLWQLQTLSVAVSGSGRVSSAQPKIDCPGICSAKVRKGTLVRMAATPAEGWSFAGWGGACSGQDTCSVTVESATSVTATFVPIRTLTVSVVGSGYVTVAPPHTPCPSGSPCEYRYVSGTTVTLTAATGTPYIFDGWSGACTGTNPVCTLTMDADKSVTAYTRIQPSVLSVSIVAADGASGHVSSYPAGIECPGDCSEIYATDTYVTLVAAPGAGSVFDGWNGIWCPETAPTCYVQMYPGSANDKSVTASFSLET